MSGTTGWVWAALVISGTALVPAKADAAGPPKYKGLVCPPPSYSPWHYHTPGLYRIDQCLHGPHIGLYAQDRYPSIQPSYSITEFPCPPVDPASYTAVRTVGLR